MLDVRCRRKSGLRLGVNIGRILTLNGHASDTPTAQKSAGEHEPSVRLRRSAHNTEDAQLVIKTLDRAEP